MSADLPTTHGAKEYRRDMAAIHDHVVRTGKPTVITRDGRPYVKIVPAAEETALERLIREGLVEMPSPRRVAVEPIYAGGDDTTSIISRQRR